MKIPAADSCRLPVSMLSILLLVGAASICRAQQPLNFDFEMLSVEGTARPWGWEFDTYGMDAHLDSSETHRGRYSVRVRVRSGGGPPESQRLRFAIEPLDLRDAVVTVGGWVKTSELDGGAYFVLRHSSDDDDDAPLYADVMSTVYSGDADWQFSSIERHIPSDTKLLDVALHAEGRGAAWFDDFSLQINGNPVDEVGVAPAFSEREMERLTALVHPLKGVDATPAGSTAAHADLEAFRRLAGDARIIALGESTHGTSEFFRLKHRMLEYAVEELGVRVFAIEDNQLVVERVNKYVLGGTGTARSSMYGMFGVWQNEEVHDMIAWVRRYNDLNADDKVEFVGFDIQNLALPVDSLLAFLGRRSPEFGETTADLLDDLREKGMNSFLETDSVKLGWFEAAGEVWNRTARMGKEWLAAATGRRDSLDIMWGIQFANLVKQFAENTYRGHESLYRDVAMAENVSWILSTRKPGTRMALWAHDNHISRGEHPDDDLNIYYGISMGSHLAKKFGDGYRAFGLSTYTGSYWAQVSYSDFTLLACPLFTAPVGSLDEALHRVAGALESPVLLLDLSKGRAEAWLSRPVPVRFANHVSIDYGYWTRFSIPYQFDGIFFIDETSAAKSYAKK